MHKKNSYSLNLFIRKMNLTFRLSPNCLINKVPKMKKMAIQFRNISVTRWEYLRLFLLVVCMQMMGETNVVGQKVYHIRLNEKETKISFGHLMMGGVNLSGKSIEVNNRYASLNGKPFIPVMGEFHFTRYPNKYWEESIQKMIAGGITIISTYVFWNIHEEREGEFDWSGDKNIRKFVELCNKNEIDVIVRIGPFCHGEIRNGGLPDWLLGRALNIRSNDPEYLFYVERLYQQIGKQLKGLLFKDGGPVIGIQLENEYQHSAAPWGLKYPGQPYDFTSAESDRAVTQAGVGHSERKDTGTRPGADHMKVLKDLAIDAGLEVPIYTATGWGNAAVIENETLPVTAAYPYPTWSPRKPSEFYLYTDLHLDPDYAPVRYNPEDYPCIAAELGGGIMNTYSRRPQVPSKGLDAMINRFIGSGANGIGYYMYHGGSTPRGQDFFFSDEAYGYPKISYDFQAPIGEYGYMKDSFHRLKLLHFFLKDFGEILAPMDVSLPNGYSEMKPEQVNKLRYAVRSKNNSGFIFMNNFQDHITTKDIDGIKFQIETSAEELRIPERGSISLKADENLILPFNLDLSGIWLRYATAQMLSKGQDDKYYVFFAPRGVVPEFSFRNHANLNISGEKGCSSIISDSIIWVRSNAGQSGEFTFVKADGTTVNFLILKKHDAMNSWMVEISGNKHLLFTDAEVLQEGDLIKMNSVGKHQIDFKIYPRISGIPRVSVGQVSEVKNENGSLFSVFRVIIPETGINLSIEKVTSQKFRMQIPATMDDFVSDIILRLDYIGDTGMGFLDGKLVADNFYNGYSWDIGLKRFIDDLTIPGEMVFYFRPMYRNATYLEDLDENLIPDFNSSGTFFNLKDTDVIPVYNTELHFN